MLAHRKATEYTPQSSCTNILQNELAKKHTIPGNTNPVAQSHAPPTAKNEGKFFMLSTISLLGFPQCVCHVVAPTRLHTDCDHNTPPRFAVATFPKKIPCGLVANLMRDCVLFKIERMLGEQTGAQIDFSEPVKTATCGGFQPCIKHHHGTRFRQPRINPDQVRPGCGRGFLGQCKQCFVIHAGL